MDKRRLSIISIEDNILSVEDNILSIEDNMENECLSISSIEDTLDLIFHIIININAN